MRKIKIGKTASLVGAICLAGAICSASNISMYPRNYKTITIQTTGESCTAVIIPGMQNSAYTIHNFVGNDALHTFKIPNDFNATKGHNMSIIVGQCDRGGTMKKNGIMTTFHYQVPLIGDWIITPKYWSNSLFKHQLVAYKDRVL